MLAPLKSAARRNLRILSALTLVGAVVVVPQVASADPTPTSGPTTGTVVTGSKPTPTFTMVDAGSTSAYAVTSNGSVYAWGRNDSGQLGNGSAADASTPQLVETPAGVGFTAVVAGSASAYALASDGRVYAWGWNGHGQLGDGSTTDASTPVLVDAPAGVSFVAVAAGSGSAYALASDGSVYAWGGNDEGQLGDGSTTDASTPQLVNTPAGVVFTAVAAGDYSAYALASNGTIYAWGYNDNGQLGDGTATGSTTPVPAVTPPGAPGGFVAMTASSHSAYGLTSDGAVYAWGMGANGQMGNGTTFASNPQVQVATPAGAPAGFSFTALAAGGYTAYALGSDGAAYAWGYNAFGQLGDGTTTDATTPVPVTTPAAAPAGFTFTALAAGNTMGYGLGSDGTVYAWGDNAFGQLGDGTTVDVSTPVVVLGPQVTVTQVTFSGVAGTNLTQDANTWQVTVPPGCGPVDVTVTYDNVTPSTQTYPDGFVYGSPPTITDPTPTIAGRTVSATVTTTGDNTPAVQWQSSTNGTTWTDMSGQTTSTLSLARPTVATSYRAVATNCWTDLDPDNTAVSQPFTVQPARGKGPGSMPRTGATGTYLGGMAALLLSAGAALLAVRARGRHA